MDQNFTANSLTKRPSLLTLAIILAILSTTKEAVELKETKMTLYIQDYSTGPNATAVTVAGIAGKLWTFTQFGTVYVTDDLITETPDPNSVLLGRSQGTYVMSALDGRNLHVSLSLVFTGKAYKGTTLQLQGTYKQFEPGTEVAVVGGTGMFRLAGGYATFETYSWDTASSHATLRLNVTLLQYYCI